MSELELLAKLKGHKVSLFSEEAFLETIEIAFNELRQGNVGNFRNFPYISNDIDNDWVLNVLWADEDLSIVEFASVTNVESELIIGSLSIPWRENNPTIITFDKSLNILQTIECDAYIESSDLYQWAIEYLDQYPSSKKRYTELIT